MKKIETLLGSERFQVIVQMGRELLAGDDLLAEEFAACFLPKSKNGTICVKSNLATATAATTLFGLISCRRDTSIALRSVKSAHRIHASFSSCISTGWPTAG